MGKIEVNDRIAKHIETTNHELGGVLTCVGKISASQDAIKEDIGEIRTDVKDVKVQVKDNSIKIAELRAISKMWSKLKWTILIAAVAAIIGKLVNIF